MSNGVNRLPIVWSDSGSAEVYPGGRSPRSDLHISSTVFEEDDDYRAMLSAPANKPVIMKARRGKQKTSVAMAMIAVMYGGENSSTIFRTTRKVEEFDVDKLMPFLISDRNSAAWFEEKLEEIKGLCQERHLDVAEKVFKVFVESSEKAPRLESSPDDGIVFSIIDKEKILSIIAENEIGIIVETYEHYSAHFTFDLSTGGLDEYLTECDNRVRWFLSRFSGANDTE